MDLLDIKLKVNHETWNFYFIDQFIFKNFEFVKDLFDKKIENSDIY